MAAKKLDLLPDTFTSNDAVNVGISQYHLYKLLNEKLIEKIRRGVYRKLAAEDLGQWTWYEIASKKVSQKNAICLLSALEYHHLAEVMPEMVWLLVDFNTRSTKSGITLFRRREPKWSVGIDQDETILVTNIERSIVECLVFKDKVGPNESYYALKTALKEKKTTVSKIMAMAERLGVKNKLMPHLEPYIYG